MKWFMKKLNWLVVFLSLIGICSLVVVITINQNVYFELKGEENITIEVNSNYVDEGFVAKVFNNDLSNEVQVKNKVDNNKIGSYDINYYLTYAGKIYMLTRTINVIDSTEPEIKLNGYDNVTIYINEKFNDEGVTAYDNNDGDITSDIIVQSNLDTSKEGNYTITYSVNDSSGNESSVARNIKVIK